MLILYGELGGGGHAGNWAILAQFDADRLDDLTGEDAQTVKAALATYERVRIREAPSRRLLLDYGPEVTERYAQFERDWQARQARQHAREEAAAVGEEVAK